MSHRHHVRQKAAVLRCAVATISVVEKFIKLDYIDKIYAFGMLAFLWVLEADPLTLNVIADTPPDVDIADTECNGNGFSLLRIIASNFSDSLGRCRRSISYASDCYCRKNY